MIRTLLLAAALAGAVVTPSWSGLAPPPPPATPPHAPPQPGPGAGPWVTGGMMVSALSLIVCGVWECKATQHEMSNQEAAFSAVVPFGCFWWRHQFSKDHGPACKP